MNIKIGEKIKFLRKQNKITQEQLAEIFNVSAAAVCKWETGETYPDITLLFSIAHYFHISIDELMGYDESVIEKEILSIIEKYNEIPNHEKYNGKCQLLIDARRKYPHDFRIMQKYMFDLAGGLADNQIEVLTKNSDELLEICNTILNGCIDEKIRLDALTLKAKIMHAKGKTKEALEILDSFPSFYHSSNQRKEQLFDKHTNEYYYELNVNLYELASFLSDKLAKSIIYNSKLSIEEKLFEIGKVGDLFKRMDNDAAVTTFNIMEMVFWGRICNHPLSYMKYENEVLMIYIMNYFSSAKKLDLLMKNDPVLKEHFIYIKGEYDSLLESIIKVKEQYHPELLNNFEYLEMKKKL